MTDPLPLQDREGILFWPRDRIAMLRAEYGSRLEAAAADGQVAHRPGPLEAIAGPPWIQVGDVWLHPRHVRRRGGILEVPGGTRLPGSLPAADPPQPIPRDGPRRLTRVGRRYRLTREDGRTLTLSAAAADALQARFGLESLDELRPTSGALRWLYRERVRDWPFELYEAEAAVLRRCFKGDRRFLTISLLWQVYRYRHEGRPIRYGTSIRGLWYVPIVNVLARAGVRHRDAELLGHDTLDPDYHAYQELLTEMVGELRLFTFRELGVAMDGAERHGVGASSPNVVLLAEKSTLQEGVQAIVARHGPSWVTMAGTSTYLATESFVDALRAAGVAGPVTVMAYVDFDPSGWAGAHAFVKQLSRYGVAVERLGFVVRPQRFAPREVKLHALPLEASTPSLAARNRNWVRESGGVHGKALGIHADNLWPVERVVRAYEAEMGALRKSPPFAAPGRTH